MVLSFSWITGLGAELKLGHRITTPPEELLTDGFEAVYIATGFQKDASLGIEGIEGNPPRVGYDCRQSTHSDVRHYGSVARRDSGRIFQFSPW